MKDWLRQYKWGWITVGALLLMWCGVRGAPLPPEEELPVYNEQGTISWVDFNIPYRVLRAALDLDLESREEEILPLDWVELLSVLGTRYGGNWNLYQRRDLEEIAEQLQDGQSADKLMEGYRYYEYYKECYTAVLGGFVGDHRREVADPLHEGQARTAVQYGLKVTSPIGGGFGYSDYDDFGMARNFGYRRNHLGHDLFGSIGTPVCAVETGVVQDACWNQFGGWTIGIRSLDGRRYWYYAHLRKDAPYHPDLEEGRLVEAGQVIGYLGMTGYSAEANVNNMNRPHLHLGLQLIFTPEQEEGANQIWVDCYGIAQLLDGHRSAVVRAEDDQYYARYHIFEPLAEEKFSIPPGP